jgi:hypothetical protein
MSRSTLALCFVLGWASSLAAAERQLGAASYARRHAPPAWSTAGQLAQAASGTSYRRRFGPLISVGDDAVGANQARSDVLLDRSGARYFAYRANYWPWYQQPLRWNYYYYRPFYPAYWNSYYWYGVYPQGYYFGPGFWGWPYYGAGPWGWPAYYPGYVGLYSYGGFPFGPDCAGGACMGVEYGGYYW